MSGNGGHSLGKSSNHPFPPPPPLGIRHPNVVDRKTLCPSWFCLLLRLTFPRAKLWRQIFMTGRNSGRRIGRKVGRNFLCIFVLHWLCTTTHQNFSPNSSQFITPCLATAPVTEISKFHLRELLGLGVPNYYFHSRGPPKGRVGNVETCLMDEMWTMLDACRAHKDGDTNLFGAVPEGLDKVGFKPPPPQESPQSESPKRRRSNQGEKPQERKFSPKRRFSAGHPCGHPAKNFGQALQILEKQAFRNGHPTRTSMKKLLSEKLRADFSFPKTSHENHPPQ